MTTHPPLLFGKYKLLELIARGGMAEVFKAKSYGADGFEKLVVIKRILPDLAQNQDFVDMAIKEAKLSVALSHANIVQVFDLGREEDTYFIVMEYVSGMDFAEVLRRCRRANLKAPIDLCVYVASETARALDYAHRRRDAQMRPLNVVHRDISPQNVLLSVEGEVKVTDFGIAKARSTVEEAGTIKGKYAYMAPEQARGLDVDARADIYALGVVLYESLAGRNPFHEPTPYQTLRRVQAGEKPPIQLAAPEVPDELARIVETAMAADRDERYPSAAKMYEELSGFLYTMGRRVGAHDLAEWLQELRGATSRDDDAHRVRDALEDIEPSSVKTPVEVPSSAGSVSRPGPGSSIAHSRPHIERRDVTLVSVEFAGDRSGAPVAKPSLDPLMAIANRYGGVVVDSGEAHVVLIFGAHEPDGRDTEMALRCALKMHQAALRTRGGQPSGIGVHAARVHVNAEGEPERDQWFTGAVALVRDLGRAAGTRILASEPVGRLIGEQFNMVPLRNRSGALERVAGVPLHVLGERPAHEAALRRFVGRKEPFRKVGEILARAAKKGAQSLALVGDAGTGKTRFLDEVHYRLRRMNHPVSWHTAACLPHEREVPLAAVLTMVRAILGIDETDPDAVMREKAKRLRELGLSVEEMNTIGVLLGTISQGDHAGAAASTLLRSALVRVATRLAQDQLTVLVWDGAENMDDESQSIVDDVVRTAGRARVVVMVACRPGFIYAWRDAPGVEEIALGPLDEDDARQLAVRRLGVAREAQLPGDLLDDLATRSGGNPLFIEEYLRSFVESGAVEVRDGEVIYRREIAEVGVPKTLRGLVASEIARLSATQRAVLQVASVVGSRFAHDVVAEVTGLAASVLQQNLFALVERGTVVRGNNDEYSFAHDLQREVVYEGLPLEARRQMHATVAAVLERLYADRLDELAERLAHHHREANDRPRAVEYLARAARKQQAEGAYVAATTNFARAIDLVLATPRPDSAQVVSLYEQLGAAAIAGRQTQVGIDRMKLCLAYVEELGDRVAIARALVTLGRLLALGGQLSDAVQHFERARPIAEALDDRAVQLELTMSIGYAFARNGDWKRARTYLARTVELAEQLGDVRTAGAALMHRARCEAASGSHAQALASWELARDTMLGIGDPPVRAELEKCLGLVHFQARQFQAAAEHSERALELAREYGLNAEQAVNAHNMGDALMRLGEYKRAFTAFTISADVAREHGDEKLVRLNEVFLAFIEAAAFGSSEGRARIEAVLTFADARGYTWDRLQARYLLGLLAQQQGDRDQARRMLREALAIAREADDQLYVGDCEELLRDVASVPPGPPTVPPR